MKKLLTLAIPALLGSATAFAQYNSSGYSHSSEGGELIFTLFVYVLAFIIGVFVTRWIFGIDKIISLQRATANELYTIRLELSQAAKERAEEKRVAAAVELQLLDYRYKAGAVPAEEYAIRSEALRRQMNASV